MLTDKRSGHYITIRHGNYTVSYCHLSEILVKKGQVLAPGEPVAISGNTGRSTAPHLHITLKYKRKRINPMIILDYIKITKKKSLEGIISGKQSSTYR
ncbi:MAG: M23 family metallopeptidase [Muribaculaceae bacterium]|nr:M23 family metallopeptidase [Muribaculaceae bacterium]